MSTPPTRRRRWLSWALSFVTVWVVAILAGAWFLGYLTPRPSANLAQGVTGVPCDKAVAMASAFDRAYDNVTKITPDYDGVTGFGFPPPINPSEMAAYKATLRQRVQEMDARASAASSHTCIDGDTRVQGTGTPTGGPCPSAYAQAFDPNVDGRFASHGVQTVADVDNLARHDARYLAFLANKLGRWSSTDASQLLAPGNQCLSREGQTTYNLVHAAFTAPDTTVDTRTSAPANYFNTGMVNNQPVVEHQPGIKGNRAAIRITLADHHEVIVMKRCANLALPAPGKLPPGPTDQTPSPTVTPSPSSPPTTAPPTTTPPGPSCTPPLIPSGSGRCILPKGPAPQPSGVHHPTSNPVGSVQPPLPSKSSPLQPQPTSAPTTTNKPAPSSTPLPTRSTRPPDTPAPSATGCAPLPGQTHC